MAPPSVREVHAHVVAAEAPLLETAAALDGAPSSGHRLVRLLDDLRARLGDYRQIVELELVPLVRDADAWGQVRAEHLLAEHEHLVEILERLCGQAEGGAAADSETACEVGALRRELAAAVHDGDAALEVVDAAEEGPIVVDQTCG